MNQEIEASWDKFLNPDSLKKNLIAGGLFLTAYEMLKESLIGYPRDMYWEGIKNGETIVSSRYSTEVRALNEDLLTASCLWWKKQAILDDSDISKIKAIREHRHAIAHEMPRFLQTTEANIQVEYLPQIAAIVKKIDQWWILEVEIPTNPDFDNRELTKDECSGVMSMRMIVLDLMIPLSVGDDSRLREIYEGWKDGIQRRQKAERTPESRSDREA